MFPKFSQQDDNLQPAVISQAGLGCSHRPVPSARRPTLPAACTLSLLVSALFFGNPQLLQTTESWRRKKKKQGGSGYMVNPVSNKNITLDQILAVEFLQQAFRRRVAQRYGGLLCPETGACLFGSTVAKGSRFS